VRAFAGNADRAALSGYEVTAFACNQGTHLAYLHQVQVGLLAAPFGSEAEPTRRKTAEVSGTAGSQEGRWCARPLTESYPGAGMDKQSEPVIRSFSSPVL
jgi:hypothetical protein